MINILTIKKNNTFLKLYAVRDVGRLPNKCQSQHVITLLFTFVLLYSPFKVLVDEQRAYEKHLHCKPSLKFSKTYCSLSEP